MKKIIFLLIVLLFTGCGSTKKISKTATSKNVAKDIVTNEQVKEADSEKIAENLKMDIDVQETITEYSKPDSVGKQYKTKVTDRKTKTKAESKKDSEKSKALERKIDNTDKTKKNTDIKTDTKDVKTESKELLYVGIAVGSIALLILLIWLIKK